MASPTPIRILISGASGSIGTALVQALAPGGTEIRTLARPRPSAPTPGGAIPWNPPGVGPDPAALAAFAPTHVVHLAGESVFGRWTAAKKQRIRDSRIAGTRLLVESLARLDHPPQVLVSASAVGFYGDRADAELTESAPPGSGFLAQVCRDWEAAAESAHRLGTRVVTLRIGVVLDPRAGALRALLPAYRLGLGGPVAGGRMWIPWIALPDTIAAIRFALDTPALRGPVNIVAPQPIRQAEFAGTLAARLHRPAILTTPGWLLSLAYGEFGREAARSSIRAVPAALLAAGFRFRHPDLASALAETL
jgi:uncharacterized protein (TIGR01777 family)